MRILFENLTHERDSIISGYSCFEEPEFFNILPFVHEIDVNLKERSILMGSTRLMKMYTSDSLPTKAIV